jgi:hypothetical protein
VKNNSTSHKALSTISKRANLKEGDDDPLWDEDKTLTKLKEARKDLTAAQKKHRENSEACLQTALEQKEKAVRDSDDPRIAKKAAAAVESLIRKHRTFESYAKIKQVTKSGMGGGLQQVDMPKRDEDGNVVQDQEGNEVREVLLEVEDIHKAILERNKCHFHQADETPFAGGAENTILYNLIGYTGMSQAAKDVVKGTFLEKHGNELKNLLPETEQLIKEMAMPEEIKSSAKRSTVKYRKTTSSRASGNGKKARQHLHLDGIWDITKLLFTTPTSRNKNPRSNVSVNASRTLLRHW